MIVSLGKVPQNRKRYTLNAFDENNIIVFGNLYYLIKVVSKMINA
jgi:hypothetical protein